MGKAKNPELENEQTVTDEPILVKGPLRDDPEPAYVPAWEVVNDRQNILTDKIPPKIYSLDALMAAGIVTEEMLEDAGYVKNTDYASATVGGVVKLASSRGLAIESNGSIYTSTFTAQNYTTAGSGTFIGKGTLENIKQLIVESALSLFCDATSSSAPVGTQLSALTMTKTESGWVLSFDTLTPPTP